MSQRSSGARGACRRTPLRKLNRASRQPAEDVARGLIGAVLVRRAAGRLLRAEIIETEAYVGVHDLACHASKGRTPRTEVMFRGGGCAYVYLIYGLHDMLNVVTGREGQGEAVLLRAARPLEGWQADLRGPGRLAKAMAISRADNGISVTCGALHFVRDPARQPPIRVATRVGIDYAGPWKDAPLRFLLDEETERGRLTSG